MKKFITIAAAAATLALPVAASASNANQPGYGNHGSEQAASVGAQCGSGAGSGAFGAFGAHGDVRHDNGQDSADGIPGANGPATGLNNSSICGNR